MPAVHWPGGPLSVLRRTSQVGGDALGPQSAGIGEGRLSARFHEHPASPRQLVLELTGPPDRQAREGEQAPCKQPFWRWPLSPGESFENPPRVWHGTRGLNQRGAVIRAHRSAPPIHSGRERFILGGCHAVEHQPRRPLRSYLHQQHHRPGEVPVPTAGPGHEEQPRRWAPRVLLPCEEPVDPPGKKAEQQQRADDRQRELEPRGDRPHPLKRSTACGGGRGASVRPMK